MSESMSVSKYAVDTPHAPAPAWSFYQGLRQGPFVQVSGQGPQDPDTGAYLYPGDVEAQTLRTLDNVRAIVEAAGARFEDIMMLRVYLTCREDFAPMNEAYGMYVRQHCPSGLYPCRTTVMVELPSEEMLVEIDAFAVVIKEN